MAKLLFTAGNNKEMGSFYGVLADGRSLGNENIYESVTITEQEYTDFITGVKGFTTDSGNVVWSDEPVCPSKEEYDEDLQNLLRDIRELPTQQPGNEVFGSKSFSDYIQQVEDIDSSAITFPLTTSFTKDIATRCADYTSLIDLK